MKKIFIGGAYFATAPEDISVYSFVADVLKKRNPNLEITTPNDIETYRNYFSLKHPHARDEEVNKVMVEYDLEKLKEADVIIADVSNKSTGLGLELGTVRGEDKFFVFIAKKGCMISNMLYGAFPNVEVKRYGSLNELKAIMEQLAI